MFESPPAVVTEIAQSIRRATWTLGRPPIECLVCDAEWRELENMRPMMADPDWHVRILGVPVRPYQTASA